MKGVKVDTAGRTCPDCEEPTDVVKLGSEPAREICGRFGCSWDGVTLQ